MNRTGLAIALAVAVVGGGLFAIHPQFDLDITTLFYDRQAHRFALNTQTWVEPARNAASWLITLLVAPALFAVLGKLLWPRRHMLIEGRAALLLAVTIALGPGILANEVLKQHWGRMRPADVRAFGGAYPFTPWWDPRGPCPENCSFIAGEPSGAFWTLAPAALTPPQWRLIAYGGALAFGAAVGGMRIAAGAHFFSDVLFAGVLIFLLIWTVHGLIYRWRPTRLNEDTIERPLAQIGEALRNGLTALGRHVGTRKR